MADRATEQRLEPSRLAGARVALVHDWLTGMRGGEKCLEVLCELFPHADVHTLFHVPGSVSPAIEAHRIRTSFLQGLPGIRRHYRYCLPLFPRAVRSLDLRGYDLIISLSHCVAKGAGKGTGTPHISYCFTPMRYLWSQSESYFSRDRYGSASLWAIHRVLERLRRWDRATHADRYVAISRCVQERILTTWDRPSEIVYPPVDLDRFAISREIDDYYLVVSALVPYKRVELAVEACDRLGRRLIVVGKGEDEGRLRALASPNVAFLGWQPDAEVTRLVSRCRALFLPGPEDFGITPLEAMASGRPVIALGLGGATETVIDARTTSDRPPTGVLFDEPTVDSVVAAILDLELRAGDFDPRGLRAHAAQFSRPRFAAEIEEAIARFAQGTVDTDALPTSRASRP